MNETRALAGRAQPSTLALTGLLLAVRLRSSWHRLRAHGRAGLLVPVLALVTPVSYVGLMTQALLELRRGARVPGDVDELAVSLMGFAVVLASFANRLAGGLSLLATLPENELLLSRPVSLARLTVARVVATTLVDPIGSLFLLPLWTAPILVWRLSGGAFLLTAAVSILLQLTVTGAAQLTDVALNRLLGPRARLHLTFVLRLFAVAALALLWIAGTEVLRAPTDFQARAAALRPWLVAGPARWIAGPLLAWRASDGPAVVTTLAGHAATAGALLGLTALTARLVARAGWEEPLPSWAQVRRSAPGAVLTAWGRELRLLRRDRNRLALILLVPVTFVAVPLLTAQGWEWTSASPHRLAMLVFSMLVYLAASGPLLHMQGEQRAFWILQTVPVSLGRIFATKAAVWASLFALLGLTTFVALAGTADLTVTPDLASTGLLLVVGCVGLAFLAVGLGATAVDFTDPSRPALGPGWFYAFLFVAGLYNVALAEPPAVPVRGTLVFGFAVAAAWHTGLNRARWAHDADEIRKPAPRASDAALLVLVSFLAPLAASRLPEPARAPVAAFCDVGVVLAALRLLSVGRKETVRLNHRALSARFWTVLGAGAGLALGWIAATWGAVPPPGSGPMQLLGVVLATVARELVLRGVVQRILEHVARSRSARRRDAEDRSAVPVPLVPASLPAAGVVLLLEAILAPRLSATDFAVGLVATALRARTGRLAPALAFHLAFVLGALATSRLTLVP